MAKKERPLYTLYKGLKAGNFDVPDNYDSFERTLTEAGNGGANSRHALYNNLRKQNFDVPDTYEKFYSNLFTPVNKTTSRALGGYVPMSDADKAWLSAAANEISQQARQSVNRLKNAKRAAKLKQLREKQKNDFGIVNLGTNKTPYGTENAVYDRFGVDPYTGKAGTYITTSGVELGNAYEAGQQQKAEDDFNNAYMEAVNKGDIPSVFDVVDKNGNYDLFENVGKNGVHVTEEGKRKQITAKITDAQNRLDVINKKIHDIDYEESLKAMETGGIVAGQMSQERRLLGLTQSQLENEVMKLKAVIGDDSDSVFNYKPVKFFGRLWDKTPLGWITNGFGAAVNTVFGKDTTKEIKQGLDNTMFTASSWDFGVNDFRLMFEMENIQDKIKKGLPLTNDEKRLAQSKIGSDAADALADNEMGNAYRWASIAGQSAPFMLDFFMTDGYGVITKAFGKAGLKFAAKEGMGTLGKNIMKYTGVVAGDVLGSYAMAGTEQFAKTGADIMNRHLGTLYQDENGNYKFGTFDENGNLLHEGGEGFGKALYKGLTAAMIENYTEKFFRHTHFTRATKQALSNHFPKFASFLYSKGAPKWMQKLGIDGLGEEIMEEEIGIPLNALLVGDNKFSDLGDIQQQADIVFGIGLCVGAMYAVNAAPKAPKGAAKVYNNAQYYRFRNKLNNVDSRLQQMMGDRWDEWKEKIDNTPNEDMGALVKKVLKQKKDGTLNEQEINTIGDYIKNLSVMRGYNLAKAMEATAKKDTGEEDTPEEGQQQEREQSYSEGQNAEGEEKHEIQQQLAEQESYLAKLLGVSEEQLANMDLESLLGQDDNLDIAIYNYQNAYARYQGVIDNAQSTIDNAEENARQEVLRRTDTSRGTVRNATIKSASNDLNGGEDYGVYIVSGNVATNEDGTINISDSDSMILYFDPLTGKIEHGDASMFSSIGDEVDAEQVIQQTAELARQDAIAGVTGEIDGKVKEGSQFVVIDNQGQQHIYEVLSDNGDGTASISIDGNVVEGIYPTFTELQQLKDNTDKIRLNNNVSTQLNETAEDEKEADEKTASIDFSQLINSDGKIQTAIVQGEEERMAVVTGTTPSGKLRISYVNDDGTIEKRKGLLTKDKVTLGQSMSVDEYQKLLGNVLGVDSTEEVADGGVVENTDEVMPAPITEEEAQSEDVNVPSFKDGTPIPVDEKGEADFSEMTPEQATEWYDSNLGDDAQGVIDANVASTKKALDKAKNTSIKPAAPSEMIKARQEKQSAIQAAQTAYDNAVAVRDAYNNMLVVRSLATAEGRKSLLDKARAKYNRLKNKPEYDNEGKKRTLWNEIVGSVLHRLYDSTGINVFDDVPQTVEEYVSSSISPYSLNYEGTETSKGVKQETGLERKDFSKSHVLAAEGKGETIDNFVHKLWNDRPSHLQDATDQDIRNALLDLITSDINAYDMSHVIENNRIAEAENILEGEERAADNAAYQEEKRKEATEPIGADTAVDDEENKGDKDQENTPTTQATEEGNNTPQGEETPDGLPFEAKPADETLPFSPNDENKVVGNEERKEMVANNKVTVDKISEAFIPRKLQRAIARIAKMMPAINGQPLKVQYLYSADADGWFDGKTNTLYLSLDSSKALQMVFGHEMTHAIKSMNTSAYDELRGLVKELLGDDFDKAADATEKAYKKHKVYYASKEDYEEEVIADGIGTIINDLNLTKGIALRMSHPLLAAFHDALMKIRLAFRPSDDGTYEMLTHAVRTIEKAYVDTANGTFNDNQGNSGEHVAFSLRQKPEPKKKGIGYKVFLLKDGKLYPPMVANPNGAATPVGVWLDADAAPIAGESKTGRPQVKQGGKGTQGGSGKLAYRPGWHLGTIPYALQFNRKDAEGNKTLFPKNFVFAEVEYAADVDYQQEAHEAGINPSGKYQHSLAGLKHLPTDGYYMYRTNPNPETDPWVITGAMKVNRLLTRAEQADLVKKAGRKPQLIQDGDIVTDEAVSTINKEIEDAPKFSLKVYHGSGADFDEFDFDHMGEGAGSQAFGWGGYVTSSKKIGKSYANLMNGKPHEGVKYIGTDDYYGIANRISLLFEGGDKDYDDVAEILRNDSGNPIKKRNLNWFLSTSPTDWYYPYQGNRNLYEVDIPDDNGNNYLDWHEPLTDEIIDKVAKKLPTLRSYDIKNLKNGTGKDLYELISMRIIDDDSVFNDDKSASKFLSSLGFTGIKYPAGTIMGGAENGDTNYVIFDPKDMKIEAHTKFSIRTYHGSQASFDHFDHSFMGSGEGAQAYGWGTYVSEVEGIAKAYAKQNAKKHTPSKFTYKGEPMTFETPTTIYQVALDMDKYNISAKEAISKMIDANEKKLSNVDDTPFGKIRKKQIQSVLNLLKGLNPSDFNIEEDYDTIAQNLADTKSGLSLLENELKDANSYVDLYSTRLEEAQKELAKAKESGTGLGVDMYESDVAYYKEQVEKYKKNAKTKESDIEDVKAKVDELQKKLDSMEKPRNLYTVEIPDDTGDNYLGWDEKVNNAQIEKIVSLLASAKDDSDFNIGKIKLEKMFVGNTIEERKKKVTSLLNSFLMKDISNADGGELYNSLSRMLLSQKSASLFLKDAGFDGVKVIAQRNTGGNKQGKMNYVIFDENNAKIVNHTKFSLKDIDKVNKEFNDALKGFTLDNSDKITFHLGMPSSDLLSGGVANKPLKLYGSKLAKKIRKHDFEPSDLIDLPKAMQHPIAVFNNHETEENRSVLTELKIKGDNALVSVTIGKGQDADINIISSTHGKRKSSVIEWFKKGLATFVNNKKAQEYLHLAAPITAASNTDELSAAKIDNSSETSKENGEKFSLRDKQIHSDAFKKWFGDWENDPEESSKMIGENGEPKVFYHNTNAEFNTFDKSKNGSNTDAGWLGDGFYFYGDENEGNGYGKNKKAVYLNIRNPYYATYDDVEQLSEANNREESIAFRKRLEDEGYDGVYYNGDLRQEVVAFYPNQIKSSENNNGDFSSENNDIRYSLRDEEYLKAVEDGDMEKAQKMVDEAAEEAGYTPGSDYQGTSAFNGSAPWGNGYYLTKEERKEAWDNGDFEGESTLGDYINDGIDGGNLEELTNSASYRAADNMRKKAILNVRNAIQDKAKTIKMYRSVPSSVKEGSFRNGDWITPSKDYAKDNAKIHGWGDDYRIIEQEVPVDEVWFDGNDIAEWGYGREEDYANDTDFAYKNTKNNRKLLDAVTYDDNGNVIPLSKRFNEADSDIRFSLKDQDKTMFGMHNISVDKLRKAIKQGGFAAPSMGVVDSKNGVYTDYGEITLIPKAEKLDKKKGKNAGTFTADAWTPTYPDVSLKATPEGNQKINRDTYDNKDMDEDMGLSMKDMWTTYLSGGGKPILMAYQFLNETGKKPKLVKYPKEYSASVVKALKAISEKNGRRRWIDDYTDDEFATLASIYNKWRKDSGQDVPTAEDLKETIADIDAKIAMMKDGEYKDSLSNYRDMLEKYGVTKTEVDNWMKKVMQSARKQGKVDVGKTNNLARTKVADSPKLSAEFNKWFDNKLEEYGVSEYLYNGETPSGKPKYVPNTIENAVKIMKKQGVVGGYNDFSVSVGTFIAHLAPSANTLTAMKKNKGKLVPFGDERHGEMRSQISSEFLDLGKDLKINQNDAWDDSGLYRMQELAEVKPRDLKGYIAKNWKVDVSDDWVDRYNKLVDTIQNNYPVFYFETKFMRPFGLDEFEKAIVPKDTPRDVLDALKNAGIDVHKYNDKKDREKVTMDAISGSDGIMFSLKSMADGTDYADTSISNKLGELTSSREVDDAMKNAIDNMPDGWKMANKKAIHVAEALADNRKDEIAGNVPKFKLRPNTLINAGTYFSGGGLVEEGLKGIINPVVAVEYDEKISGVYRNNFGQHLVTADVRDVDPAELVAKIDGDVEFFHASPVCKNYSKAKANHEEVELDKETAQSTADFINQIKPRVVTIENVKGYKDSDAMKIITDALDGNGYKWDADVYNAADYGGYTNRERLIVRAVRDGELPEKPKKLERKSGWYEAVEDIMPTLTEKKNGVAPWMDVRLKADGIDWRNIDKPLYVMGSAYADGKVPHAFADELLPTLRTKSGDVIIMPDGKVYRALGRVLARVSGMSDDYKLPYSESLAHTIIGNGIPTQLTEHVIAPLLLASSPKFSLRTYHGTGAKFSLRYDDYEKSLADWKKRNGLAKDAKEPEMPQQEPNESKADFIKRVNKYLVEKALWNTAPHYEGHLLYDDTAVGHLNLELQKGTILARIAVQDSMLPIRIAQEGIMKELGLDKIGVAEDAYTAENRSHGKAKNEFEEYNQVYLQPLRKAYHAMKKALGDSYDNVKIYMMSKHGLERNAFMAFRNALKKDFTTKEKGKKDVFDADGMKKAYEGYKNDVGRVLNDANYAAGIIDYATYRQNDDAFRTKYAPSYPEFRYDEDGNIRDYSGLSSIYNEADDFEIAAAENVRLVENEHGAEAKDLWDATNAATKKIQKMSYLNGMMSKDIYDYVNGMYNNYIPLRGWDGTSADQVWDYIGGGRGAFNQALKKAEGRKSIADDPIAYIENMAESTILLNNKNYVKQHLLLLAENHPNGLLTLSKAWYVKSRDAFGNEIWTIASPNIPADMTDRKQISQALEKFETDMKNLEQQGEATQKRGHLDIEYPQTNGEQREHEVRVLRDGEEYVIYVNGDPQLAQAMNNTRAMRVRERQSGLADRSLAWLGRKMAAAYTSLSPLFIPANFTRDLTMTLASTAIREDARYNYLLRKNFLKNWNTLPLVMKYQSGKLKEKVDDGSATKTEQMFYDFMMNGGETGFVNSLDVEDFKKKIQDDLKDMDRSMANPKRVGHAIMDAIELLNRAIEDSNRYLVYKTSIEYGRPIEEAINNAKDVTLNFNRKGTGEYGWQMVRNLYLFINPAIQSLQTLGALAKHHPYKFTAVTSLWLTSGVLVPVINQLMLSMFGDGDDKDKYWSFSKWDRRNNFIMWLPYTKNFIKIPLAQEFRGFYGLGDMIASKLMGGEKAEESWGDYALDFIGQVVDMLPLDPTGYDGNVGLSLMPNAARPVFELAFNVDFTGKPLFKDSEYNKYDPNFTKAYVGTPDWLIRTSRLVNSIGNPYPDVQQNAIDRFGDPRYNLNNPAVVDHILSSYLGGAYTFGSQAIGVLTKALNSDSEVKVGDIPLVSRFAANPDDRPVSKKQGDAFWDMKEQQDRTKNTLSKLKKDAKTSGDYSTLEYFFKSDQYAKYKENIPKIKKYEEDRKKEKAEKEGDEYTPHKVTGADIYNEHTSSNDDFEDMKMELLWKKVSVYKTKYDGLLSVGNSQSDMYYNQHSETINAADEAKMLRTEISGLKKGMLTEDGKDGYNEGDMKQIREVRKQVISILEDAAKSLPKKGK